MSDWPSEVTLVLDPHFAGRIGELVSGAPAWIVMSAANGPIIRQWWVDNPAYDPRTGVTGFIAAEGIDTEGCFLTQLDNIEEHHGPHSAHSPYTTLRVIGMDLTEAARHALSKLGFSEFMGGVDGFSARRGEEWMACPT